MARCKNCGRSVANLTPDGLCKECGAILPEKVREPAEVIRDLLAIVDDAPELGLKVLICDLILQNAGALAPYERRGIPTIDPLPSELLRLYGLKRDTFIVLALSSEVRWAKDAAAAISVPKARASLLARVLDRVREYKGELRESQLVRPLEQTLLDLIHEARLAEYMHAAESAERAGQRGVALDRYREALAFLKRKDVAGRMGSERITAVEGKILELGGET